MYSLHYEKFQDGSVKCIEDEIPFELPEGWEWCRVRDIATVKGGKRLPKGVGFSPCRTAHAYIRVTDMKNHSINTDDLKYISEEVFLQIKNYTISKDDLYVTIAGTIGVTGEVPTELDGMNLTENAVKITNIQINKTYLCLIIQSEFVERFPELSLFYELSSPLDSEMICIFPYFCPYEESAREIRDFLFSRCLLLYQEVWRSSALPFL